MICIVSDRDTSPGAVRLIDIGDEEPSRIDWPEDVVYVGEAEGNPPRLSVYEDKSLTYLTPLAEYLKSRST